VLTCPRRVDIYLKYNNLRIVIWGLSLIIPAWLGYSRENTYIMYFAIPGFGFSFGVWDVISKGKTISSGFYGYAGAILSKIPKYGFTCALAYIVFCLIGFYVNK
jgi:hypothetical protein